MNAFLVIPFALACIVGGFAAISIPRKDGFALAAIILVLCSGGLAGALIVAAEAGSVVARYLGLIAVLFASAVLPGAIIAIRRGSRGGRP